jgi:hypothetical protein
VKDLKQKFELFLTHGSAPNYRENCHRQKDENLIFFVYKEAEKPYDLIQMKKVGAKYVYFC